MGTTNLQLSAFSGNLSPTVTRERACSVQLRHLELQEEFCYVSRIRGDR